MPSFNIEVPTEIEFEVYCSCGNGLCNQSTVGERRGYKNVTVEPCDRCLSKANDEGYSTGWDKGYEAAKTESHGA